MSHQLYELHAHLNGCMNEKILKQLFCNLGEAKAKLVQDLLSHTAADNVWKKFAWIEQLVDSLTLVEALSSAVVQDFAEKGVQYLELRSTPKIFDGQQQYADYLRAMVKGVERGVQEANRHNNSIKVRLLLSINRARHSMKEAREVIRVASAAEFWPWVVGVDFSGNPDIHQRKIFLPQMEELLEEIFSLSSCNFGAAIHYAEDPRDLLGESRTLLNVLEYWRQRNKKMRLGHAVFIDEWIKGRLCELKIPVETCMTSNSFLENLFHQHLEGHPCVDLARRGVPVIPCTDDPGVIFPTTPEKEYTQFFQILGFEDQRQSYWQENILSSIF